MKQNPLNNSRGFIQYTSMALQMIVAIVGATFLGKYIDQRVQSKFPTATLVGVFVGIGIALYRVFNGLKEKK
jgi:hypothetical protein